MDAESASEHLQVIRTLMERAAVYRRALAPVTLATGCLGLIAAVCARVLQVTSPNGFVGMWMAMAVVALVVSFLIIRRQALHAAEPFWSPPTRRVAFALAPALVAGFAAGALLLLCPHWDFLPVWALPGFWMLLYGCALNAAGFFMMRGIKLLGWIFLVAGISLMATRCFADGPLTLEGANLLMGLTFGGLHIAYGAYLYFTENRGQPS